MLDHAEQNLIKNHVQNDMELEQKYVSFLKMYLLAVCYTEIDSQLTQVTNHTLPFIKAKQYLMRSWNVNLIQMQSLIDDMVSQAGILKHTEKKAWSQVIKELDEFAERI